MSVVRSKRTISKTEFENTFIELYRFSEMQTAKISNRRKRWLCEEYSELMNEAFNNIMDITESFYHRSNDKEYTDAKIIKTLNLLYMTQKRLYVMWNVSCIETKKMAKWCDLLQKECGLLIDMLDMKNKNDKRYDYKFKILDYRYINKAEFLRKMSEFHRFIHGKVTNAPKKYDNTSGQMLIDLADSTLFLLIKANSKIPTTKEEYESRKKCIELSISNLYKIQRHILFYCNLMNYSERVLEEWCDYVVEELKLLHSLKKSDAKRFGNLRLLPA